MIASIHGILETSRIDQAIIRVGGFSIRVFAPSSTLRQLGDTGTEVTLFTHFHVREDDMTLYGFITEEDREAFERLIGVSGVGPKLALALLSAMDAQTFYRAIADEDQQRLAMAPGVGKRLAARLVLELKGKLPALTDLGTSAPAGSTQHARTADVVEALMGLGFSSSEAQAALSKLPQDQSMSLEEQITFALRSFSRG